MNQIISNKTEIMSEYKIILTELMDTEKLDMEASQVQIEMDIALELLQKCVMENTHIAMDQEDYQQRYSGYAVRYDVARRRLAEINEQYKSLSVRGMKAEAFLNSLADLDGLITDFNHSIWYTMVDRVTVERGNHLTFLLCNEIKVEAPQPLNQG
jgi:uncharacterized protein YutD